MSEPQVSQTDGPAGPAVADQRPHRVLIVGGQGTGKSTLARAIARDTGWPLHELDLVARVGGGTGPERPIADRDADIAAIASEETWIAEGVHLGWTEPLLARAERIVWLDHVRGRATSARMIRRFGADAWREMRTRRGRERFLRLRDYAGHARDLVVSVGATRHGASGPDPFEVALAPHMDVVVRCRTAEDVARVERAFRPEAPGRPAGSRPIARSDEP